MPVSLQLVMRLAKLRHLTPEAAAARLGLTLPELLEANTYAHVTFRQEVEPVAARPEIPPSPHWTERVGPSDRNRRFPKEVG